MNQRPARRRDRVHPGARGTCAALALLSAVLLPLALPNDLYVYGNPALGFVALAPLFLSLYLAPSFRFASLLGVLFGGVSTFIVHYWLMFFGEYSLWTVGGVVIGYMGYHALLAAYLYGLARAFPRHRAFVLAAAWALYEYLKSSGFLAFPWGLLPHSVSTVLPLIQFIDVTGLWGLTLVLALGNTIAVDAALLFVPALRRSRELVLRQTAVLAVCLAMALVYGAYALSRPLEVSTQIDALLVQHNEDPWASGRPDEAIMQAQRLTLEAIEARGKRPDIVVWSETAIRHFLKERTLELQLSRIPRPLPLRTFLRTIDTHLLVGAPFAPAESEDYQNSALLLSPQGRLADHYGKQHLVPLAESIPLYDVPLVESFFGGVLGLTQGWEPGDEAVVMELPLRRGGELRFAAPVCFEDAFPNLCRRFVLRGAHMWINLTNVSWSRTESAEVQMLVAARFRSVENRRVMIRCTNGGVTSVIDPWGRVRARLDLFTEAVLFETIPVYTTRRLTPYTLYGDYLPLVLAVLLPVLLAVRLVRLRFSARTDRPSRRTAS